MTQWFERGEDDIDKSRFVDDVSEDLNPGGAAFLLHDGTPDWVKHPQTGERLRVTEHKKYKIICPNPDCKTDVVGMITTVDNHGKPLRCLACPACRQYIWFGGSL